ncbi:T9SS type A sorting domain-containing protein [Rufibacter immobilis]|uniref:T9SS type A sorting domain-containing protein n=1 Tax=Rufibacter immobilis TaxID=1348778 RepID=UPI0035E9F2D7
MKLILPLLIVGVVALLQGEAYAQRTTLYHENFSGTVSNVSYNTGTHSWQTSANHLMSTVSYGQASLGNYVKTGTAPGSYILELVEFSTAGYEGINVNWGAKRTGEPTIKLEYSFNNGQFVEVTGWADVGYAWSKVNAGNGISLPTCYNKGKVKLRWTYIGTGSSFYELDDITITGIPHGGPDVPSATSTFSWKSRPATEMPLTYAKYGTTTFYEKDEVKMQWDREVHGQVNTVLTRALYPVKDMTTPALALEQRFATTSDSYTKTKLYFTNRSVSGLSFTIYDVDRTGNSGGSTLQQFVDVVEVVAYRNGSTTPIYPKKQHAQVTRYNNYVAGGGGHQFKSKDLSNGGKNIDLSSNEGDVTVTFHEPVDRVEILYFNDAFATSDIVSYQSIYISDLSWRSVSLPTPKVDNTTPSTPGGNGDPTPLPVTLVGFTAKRSPAGIILAWSTAAEVNNDRFVVERSTNGKTFAAIGEVKGSGNSSVLQHYAFTDPSPQAGINYYRLTQYDHDGKFETSAMVHLAYTGTSSMALSAFPNPVPANSDLTIKAEAPTPTEQTLYILNAAGKLVKQVTLPKEALSVQVPVQDLPSGLYLVRSGSTTSKFYKQ